MHTATDAAARRTGLEDDKYDHKGKLATSSEVAGLEIKLLSTTLTKCVMCYVGWQDSVCTAFAVMTATK
jgi:hypothetical protein